MIIVEGPDGGGKTTLVNKLASELGIQIGKRATADRDKLYTVTRQDTYKALASAVKGHKAVRIWDRLFYSEMIYHQFMDRPCEFSGAEQILVGRVIRAIGCPVILCLPPPETVLENVEDGHQMGGVKDHAIEIYQAYRTMFNENSSPYLLWYDYTEKQKAPGFRTYKDLVDHCGRYMAIRKERMW